MKFVCDNDLREGVFLETAGSTLAGQIWGRAATLSGGKSALAIISGGVGKRSIAQSFAGCVGDAAVQLKG